VACKLVRHLGGGWPPGHGLIFDLRVPPRSYSETRIVSWQVQMGRRLHIVRISPTPSVDGRGQILGARRPNTRCSTVPLLAHHHPGLLVSLVGCAISVSVWRTGGRPPGPRPSSRSTSALIARTAPRADGASSGWRRRDRGWMASAAHDSLLSTRAALAAAIDGRKRHGLILLWLLVCLEPHHHPVPVERHRCLRGPSGRCQVEGSRVVIRSE